MRVPGEASAVLRRNLANIITVTRIVCSIAMMLLPVKEWPFMALYVYAGVSDIVDGRVARRTGTESRLGANLDSLADCMFVAVFLLKLLPSMYVPIPLVVWMVAIVGIKSVNALIGLEEAGCLGIHSRMSKLTGHALFLLPFTLPFVGIAVSGTVLCAMATVAAVQEGRTLLHRRASMRSEPLQGRPGVGIALL